MPWELLANFAGIVFEDKCLRELTDKRLSKEMRERGTQDRDKKLGALFAQCPRFVL